MLYTQDTPLYAILYTLNKNMPNSHKEKIAFCRPTWAEVNLDNLAHNFRLLREKTGGGVKIMPMVKADAYGHGMIPCARKLAECGADYFGVASIEEGIRLRRAGISLPVLVLGAVLSDSVAGFFDAGLIPALCDWETALALEEEARRRDCRIKVHIKVDTGMGRIGVLWNEADVFIRKVGFLEHIEIEGLFTHFPCADEENNDLTAVQEERFLRVAASAERSGVRIQLLHAANSAAILNRGRAGFNMVRPGLALYGVSPLPGENDLSLKPVLSLKSRLVYVKRLPAGSGVSYGHTYRVPDECVVATVPLGYGDGYPRNLSNCGPVLIGGRRYKISGRICMDQLMVDAGRDALSTGEEAVFIGGQGKEEITARELAALGGTIAYEILCGIGGRVPRVYRDKTSLFTAEEDWREKRLFTRFPAEMRMRFSCGPGGLSAEARTHDISASGLSFVFGGDNGASPALPLHSRLDMHLLDKRGAEVLRTAGDVVWSRMISPQRYSAGVTFTGAPGTSTDDIRSFLRKYCGCRNIFPNTQPAHSL